MEKIVIVGINETADRILYFCEHYHLFDVIAFAVDSKYKREETHSNRPVWELETLSERIKKER